MLDLGFSASAAFAVFTVGAALAVFFQRSLMRAVVAITLSFLGSAVVFYMIGQGFIALLQLFVFVGGLSTYLMVAVSSEHREFGNRYALVALAVVFAAGLSVMLMGVGDGQPANQGSYWYFAAALGQYWPFIFVISLALFGAAMASVLVIRRFVRLVV
ncbi:MAG: hypothetical protein M1321_01620 [Candidatus Marsarchaeota archaeon]|nr:hypothetical protein [Candidatus Marsarchaeota archaeon]